MIDMIIRTGRRYHSDVLTLYRDDRPPGPDEDFAGAFLVPKSAGNAVERNRIKRWLREDFRIMQKENRICGGFILKFKGRADEVSHRQLTGELSRLYNLAKFDA